MVRELVAGGLTVVWSTAYLDEAELCQEVLLLNEGELLFAGEPGALTGRLRDRCFQIRDIAGNRRQVLTRALCRPEILDGVIQGHSVRLVLRPGQAPPDLAAARGRPAARYWRRCRPGSRMPSWMRWGAVPAGNRSWRDNAHQASADREIVAEARDLTRKFGDFTAVDRVSFEVRRGEVFGLLGPNGAGKSTTFRMLCGLLTPTSGDARVMGIDLKKSPGRARQKLGYMAQKFSLYGNLTVGQNLAFFSGAYGLRGRLQREAVERLVTAFKFEPPSTPRRFPPPGLQTCAWRWRARSCTSRTSCSWTSRPREWTPSTRREFWTHINGLVEKQVTIIVTTHFMDEAEYCDRIALVYRGRVIAAGTPDQLKSQVATADQPEPSMEDAFVGLVRQQEAANPPDLAQAKGA
jgi:ABC-2 type transport system ATP-binding protein